MISSAFFSFQPRIAPLSATIHFILPCFGSSFSTTLMPLPAPARLPDFSAAAPTCCFAGSAPATSACAASRISEPCIRGSTTATATYPIRASPATTSKAARIFFLPFCVLVPSNSEYHFLTWRRSDCGSPDACRASAFATRCKTKPQKLGLAGWVRNRSDGSVEALARGSPHALEALAAWARRGPPAARVTEVRVEPAAERNPPMPASSCGRRSRRPAPLERVDRRELPRTAGARAARRRPGGRSAARSRLPPSR